MTLVSAGLRFGCVALGLLTLTPGLAGALTLDDALRLAEERAPQISARQHTLAAFRSVHTAAGALPDPKLIVGVDNYPISGPSQYSLDEDFMTMQKIGVMQEVPNGDKRAAVRERAEADVARTESELRVERLSVRRETALAWLNTFFLERKRALLDELVRENRIFAASVSAQLAGGRGSAADVVIPRQEAAMLADRRDDLERDTVKARAALFRWVGDPANEPLTGEPPLLPLTAEHLRHGLSGHPELAVFGPLEEAARAEVAMAQAEKKPGWSVEFDYQKRGPSFGDMVSLQFTFDLPLFAKTRQDPQIAAKVQELQRISSEREVMFRQHAEELEGLLSEQATLTRQIERLDAEWLPLAQERVELALAGYRAGRDPLTGTLDARKSLLEARLKRIELASQRAALDARLHYLNGEDRP